MVNIKDVALLAEVSVTTVSHVVNSTRFVKPDTRLRVEQAVRSLGYVPSGVARSLKSNTTRTFGVLIPNNSNPYFAEILRGWKAAASPPTTRSSCAIPTMMPIARPPT
jgi:LacI family transcriptional regulator